MKRPLLRPAPLPQRDWSRPILRERLAYSDVDPLVAQIRDFCAVIRGRPRREYRPAKASGRSR